MDRGKHGIEEVGELRGGRTEWGVAELRGWDVHKGSGNDWVGGLRGRGREGVLTGMVDWGGAEVGRLRVARRLSGTERKRTTHMGTEGRPH